LARIRVEVLYALPHAQQLVALELSEGATVRAALQASGLLEGIPVLVRPRLQFGVYGKLVGPERVLRNGDRVEILRPLPADPKEARRRRVQRRA
jgi:putative ubiquitin-RnfH superfamily antitoxin RatB of RatAB toxin-antitoxin module